LTGRLPRPPCHSRSALRAGCAVSTQKYNKPRHERRGLKVGGSNYESFSRTTLSCPDGFRAFFERACRSVSFDWLLTAHCPNAMGCRSPGL
jgi:hypothetical protein